MSLVASLLCNAPAAGCPASVDGAPPGPETLGYTFALPGALATPRIARGLVGVVLEAHQLGGMGEAALQVVGELAACACRFAAGGEVSLALRYRDEELWIVLGDGHRPHRNPRIAALCDARREDALRVLDLVVVRCEGEWGYGDVLEPGAGARVWAALPKEGAESYGRGTSGGSARSVTPRRRS
ncbi:ATP-binding protein [Streptomyces iconiensis]|uniref:ATP-binding protein n=1 Tax=Streptomyces iconiensis TaxID=1384038 RepID=A0ABT6ZZV3_9ACTN|nr:ATP-binding protein [Streptomyces iconiensis]MDJ1134612.1 ATP-binding protein [Streptomyces iconiensis]